MNRSLRQFAQQLASWTEEIIEFGRVPFRKVDTLSSVWADGKSTEVPLIFWINRQSLMAGGILLLPDNSLEAELERGRQISEALGLRHFATWEKHQVRIWQCQPSQTTEYQTLPIDEPDNLASFRLTLEKTLEALKLTAVLGAIPPGKLGTSYFHNLIQTTLQQVLPATVDAFRSQRSGDPLNDTADADTRASELNRQILLQILALLWRGDLPDSIMPESLQEALKQACHQLPRSIAVPLCLNSNDPLPLPSDVAVAYHHLLLRLRQLAWPQSDDQAKATIVELSDNWFPGDAGPQAPHRIYPQAPPDQQTELVLSDSPSLLSLTALQQQSKTKEMNLLLGPLFTLDRSFLAPSSIHARLGGGLLLTGAQKNQITARLRTAWPHRRFQMKAGQALWFWELIHLLGTSHSDQEIHLDLPVHALQTAADDLIWQIIGQNFQLREISQKKDRLVLLLFRRAQLEQPVLVRHGEETRELQSTALPQFRTELLLALHLSHEIYSLIGQELTWCSGAHTENAPAMDLYRKSRLFSLIQSILANRDTNGQITATQPNTEAFSLQPEPNLIKQLNDEIDAAGPELSNGDTLLASVLLCPSVKELPQALQVSAPTVRQKPEPKDRTLHTTIEREAERFGIPSFPEQYLYFIDSPHMVRYHYDLPLTEKDSFLGEFTLEDSSGQAMTGTGEELKQALLLCSQLEKPDIELPSDLNQINAMLVRYRNDLKALFNHISDISLSQHSKTSEARKLVKKVWKNLPLPDPTWFKD